MSNDNRWGQAEHIASQPTEQPTILSFHVDSETNFFFDREFGLGGFVLNQLHRTHEAFAADFADVWVIGDGPPKPLKQFVTLFRSLFRESFFFDDIQIA